MTDIIGKSQCGISGDIPQPRIFITTSVYALCKVYIAEL